MRNIDLNEGIDRESLVDLLCTAFYGCDWAYIETLPSEDKIDELLDENYVRTRCIEDKWADRLLHGGHLVITDLFDENQSRYELTLDKINKGLRRARDRQAPYDWCDFIEENDDYFTCNNLIQVCIFSEVVYG